jgi:hypothetical protein
MKIETLTFNFHEDLNRHHPRKPHRHLVKAHHLPAPNRHSHLRNPHHYPSKALGYNSR